MKISNSKKQLAKIISENGGWREGSMFSAQDQDGEVFFYVAKPTRFYRLWRHQGVLGGDWINCRVAQPNWHQTILSRDEYFHLYPTRDAELVAMCEGVTEENKHPECCEAVMRSIPEPSDKPTIEQLAYDYKAKLAISQRAQEVADSHRCGAEAALKLLELAGAELGLVIGVCETPKQEAELNITDWRDLQVGDEVEASYRGIERVVGIVLKIDVGDNNQPIFVSDGVRSIWATEFRFIRRP